MSFFNISLSSQEKKILTLSALGGMLEFYDFVIYGIFSVYFAHQFFPSHNDLIIIIQSYLVFVLGYIARPIGGIIFSHIGDEYGRKKVLVLTIVLMGISSLGIGLLPTYASLGIYAPILLLTLRLLQGLALGGELPSTFVYISESIPHKRGIAFGITMSGVNGGLLFGMVVNYVLNHLLSDTQLNQFGWRLPFIIGGLVCVISYRIRQTLHETAAFNKIHDRPKLPFVFFLKNHLADFFAGTALVGFMAASVVVAVVFMPTYLQGILKLSSQRIGDMMMVVMVVNVITIFCIGLVAQKYRPSLIFLVLMIANFILVPVGYGLIKLQYYFLGVALLALLEGTAAALTPLLLTGLFSTQIRLTGVSLCYNVGFTLFGALAPLIITHGIKKGHGPYIVPIIYLIIVTLLTTLSLPYFNQSRKIPR